MALVSALLLEFGQVGAGGVARAADSTSTGPDKSLAPKPIRVVVLVDESGSLSTQDVDRERSAAALLVAGELSPQSQMAVLGFGSSDAAGQSAIDDVCPLLQRDSAANQQALLTCVEKLHRRTAAEGNGTDHVAALNQALGILDQPDDANRAKIIVLLTDGVLDVSNSPGYGGDPATRQESARAALASSLAQARDDTAEIWPLGFGGGIDPKALENFAKQGGQRQCNGTPDSVPRASTAATSAKVIEALVGIFAASRCAQVSPFSTRTLDAGTTVELPVQIPPISTDGSIVVLKGDPRVSVSYIDPQGRTIPPAGGTVGDSVYEFSATNGPAESLHVVDPQPGTWKVRLTAGPGVPKGDVVATAIWQGRLQSSIVVDPPQPRAGTDATVTVRIASRLGAVTDGAQLRSLTVGATMTGATVATQTARLVDDGTGGDRAAHDGEYTGHIAVPASASGPVAFTGTVDGPGVVTDTVTTNTQIASGPPALTADIALPGGKVRPGSTVAGTLTLNNLDGTRHRLRLRLTDLTPGTLATLTAPAGATVTSNAPGRITVPVHITLARGTRLGSASGRVQLVDPANGNQLYAETFLGVDVGYPPSIAHRLWWLWPLIGVLLLAAVAAAVAWRRAVRRRRDVRGVVVLLLRDGAEIQRLPAPKRPAREMAFAIREPTSHTPQLDHARTREKAYTARRDNSGGLSVHLPTGRTVTVTRSRPALVEDGLQLGFVDERRGRGRPGAGGRPGGARDTSRESARGRDGSDRAEREGRRSWDDRGSRRSPGWNVPGADPPGAGREDLYEAGTTPSATWREKNQADPGARERGSARESGGRESGSREPAERGAQPAQEGSAGALPEPYRRPEPWETGRRADRVGPSEGAVRDGKRRDRIRRSRRDDS